MIGLDLAKHVFQGHGADAPKQDVIRKLLRRSLVLKLFGRQSGGVVAMETCPSKHFLSRRLTTLVPGKVHLELGLTPGAEGARAEIQFLDVEADGHATDVEAQTFAQEVLDLTVLTLDGEAISWTMGEVGPPDRSRLETRNAIPKITAIAPRSDSAGSHTLRYESAESLWMANIFLQAGEGWQYQYAGQERSRDGGQLTVDYTVAEP